MAGISPEIRLQINELFVKNVPRARGGGGEVDRDAHIVATLADLFNNHPGLFHVFRETSTEFALRELQRAWVRGYQRKLASLRDSGAPGGRTSGPTKIVPHLAAIKRDILTWRLPSEGRNVTRELWAMTADDLDDYAKDMEARGDALQRKANEARDVAQQMRLSGCEPETTVRDWLVALGIVEDDRTGTDG